jgi:carbon-monoxide dehydrogenase medium subunit
MRGFEYLSPTTLPEALSLLRAHCGQAKMLAGGTDLLIQMKAGEVKPRYLIDLKRIQALQGVEHTRDAAVMIYPLTRIADLASMKDFDGAFSILKQAAQTVGSMQIRNRATIGGNICRAAPSADMVPALLVLNSQIEIMSAGQERWIPIAEFFMGPGRTVLQPHEILSGIRIPLPPEGGKGVYLKLGPRQTMDLATVGVAVFLSMDADGAICRDIRIAVASVAPKPMRAFEAEKVLVGNPLSQGIIFQAAKKASLESSPITDIYGPDWYKREMVEAFVKRAISAAKDRIRGKNETKNQHLS